MPQALRKKSQKLAPETVPYAKILIFVPYAREGSVLVSPYYETPEFRADAASWMAALGSPWEWVVVTQETVDDCIARARQERVIVLNLCDGDEINGYPGPSVVAGLEAARIPFTGADSRFYAVSTSKLAMKRRFAKAKVPTADWVVIEEPERDLARAARQLGFPLFLKPDISFGSAGISVKSVVHDPAAARARAEALLQGMHGCRFGPGGIFAEPFIEGQEFTVMVVSDETAPQGVRVLTPAERVFHSALPAQERFLT
ncbi:MAG TPA: hypothetical protein VKT70_09770, partial [Stellaceae bacterium]|nr:hypothetical protein [Stellaceae bacterium]